MRSAVPPILECWTHPVAAPARAIVLPDGCRDLIALEVPGRAPEWFVSALFLTAEAVECRPGQVFRGFRLAPGAEVDVAALLAALAARPDPDEAEVTARLAEHVRHDPRVTEALACLAGAPGIAAARRELGVSERSLQRLLAAATGRSPEFWRGLARVRRAGAALAGDAPLAEIAAEHGYADQAHMTRAFRRWFAASPARFRARSDLLEMVRRPGYG